MVKYMQMKRLWIAVAGMALAAVAAGAALPSVPEPTTPSSEASVVCALPETCRYMRRFELNVSFWGGFTNCLQVALGRDADGDGDLSPEETGAVYGWNAGRCFVENVATGGRFWGGEHAVEGSHVLIVAIEPGDSPCPHCSASIKEDGVSAFTNVTVGRPAWLFNTGWNMVKVTRRGDASPNASVNIDRQFAQGLRIVVR